MPPVPKRKHTRSRTGIRRNSSSKKRLLLNLYKCPSCGKLKESHKACPHCGFYK